MIFVVYTTREDFDCCGVHLVLYTTGGDFEFCGVHHRREFRFSLCTPPERILIFCGVDLLHTNERLEALILLICQYSKYSARFSLVGLKQGFRAYVYMIWIVLFFYLCNKAF